MCPVSPGHDSDSVNRLQLSPPQDIPDCCDNVNLTPKIPTKLFTDFELSYQSLNIVLLHRQYEWPPLTQLSIRPSEPQPPEIELEDNTMKPTFPMKQLEEIIKGEMNSELVHKSLQLPDTVSSGNIENISHLLRLVQQFLLN